MGWGKVTLNSIPLLVNLVHIAEKAFNGEPHSGKQKKKFVHQAAKDIMIRGEDIATGGAKDTLEAVNKVAPDLIDTIAEFFFEHKTKPKTEKPIAHESTGLAYDDYKMSK